MGDLWVWTYALKAAGGLNARTGRREYRGALVREGAGFGCVHPWPELGDPALEDCLEDLAGERRGCLVRRTVACLEADGGARMEGRSLFEGLTVPVSHATLPAWTREAVEVAVARGFQMIKVKAGREVAEEMRSLRELVRAFPELRWRVDFNEQAEAGELVKAFAEWRDEERGRIDFLEDPVGYRSDDWKRVAEETGLVLANDRAVADDDGKSEVLVIKPAVNEMRTGKRVVVTSYLDHPVGQVFAAWEAARAEGDEVCGLQTHGLFGGNEFIEILGEAGPAFRVPPGAGLGFGDLLEKLPWTRLGA